MPLHPDLEAFLELAAMATQGGRPPMSSLSPQRARAAYDQSTLALDSAGPALPVQQLTIASRDGHPLPVRLYRGPSAAPGNAAVLLYFHGGGYVLGGLASHDGLCRSLAHQAGCAVLALDYRLAPEHRFPTAFNDAEDAAAWLRAHAAALGLDRERIAYGGDSVGATLASALTIAARNAGHAQPRLQLLLYPCTASWQDSPSHQRYAHGYLLEADTLQWMFGHYLSDAEERRDWRFAPLEAADLSGLAPAHIVLAEYDPLLDEGRMYAQRLRAAGVPTQLEEYPGMVHDFARLGNIVAQAGQLRRDLGQALARALR